MKPYADAPRLPDGEKIDVRDVAAGAWIEIELGPGRGGFIMERAEVVPEAGLIGLEIRRKWAAIVDGRLAKKEVPIELDDLLLTFVVALAALDVEQETPGTFAPWIEKQPIRVTSATDQWLE